MIALETMENPTTRRIGTQTKRIGYRTKRIQEPKPEPTFYSVTIFTQKWEQVREFYVSVLGARVISERYNRYCDMVLGGLPLSIRPCEFGEDVSFLHIYLALAERTGILKNLRDRGVIVTFEGPYANFRDPEGRVFKLSETEAILA